MRLTRGVVLIACLLAAARPAAAAPPPGKPPAVPPAVAAVNQFVDGSTVLVAHVDVPALDPEALNAWLLSMLKAGGSSKDDVDGAAYLLRGLIPPAKKWAGDFGRAGGRSLFVVGSADPAMPALVVVPVEGRANAAGLAELMMSPLGIPLPAGKPVGPAPAAKPGQPAPPAPPAAANGYFVERLGAALVLGNETAVRRARDVMLATGRPARPELTAGLTDSGGGTIRASFAMTADLREQLKGIGPNLPAELGGEPTAVLTERLRWAALSVHAPTGRKAEMTIRLTLQGADDDTGKRLANVLRALFRTAANDGDFAKHPDKDKVLSMVEPKVVGPTVEVLLGQAELTKSAGVFGPLASKARREAAKSQSETRIKQIVSAVRNASTDLGGRMPMALTDPPVLKYLGNTPALAREALVNPLQPDRMPGYQYVRPADNALQIPDPLRAIVVYEIHDKWPADGIRVGLAIGAVAEIKTEAELKARLRAQGAK
ncbi:MAG TPA: hypothetical protein VF796_14745 [Humisphaera sp.]